MLPLSDRPRAWVQVFFNTTTDGVHWTPVNTSQGFVYSGGVSEVGWTFDLAGNLWAVLRNEDGDDSGWGSRIAFAQSTSLGDWALFPGNVSDEYIYESPRAFRFGKGHPSQGMGDDVAAHIVSTGAQATKRTWSGEPTPTGPTGTTRGAFALR